MAKLPPSIDLDIARKVRVVGGTAQQWVILSTLTGEPALQITALAGDDPSDLGDGFGGWQQADRPGRVAYTYWTGFPALRLSLPLILVDDYAGVDTVENEIATLIAMAGRGRGPNPAKATPVGQPRPLGLLANPISDKSLSAIVPRDLQANYPGAPAWAINALTWGAVWRNTNGRRYRQDVTVELLQLVTDSKVDSAIERYRLTVTPGGFVQYTIRAADRPGTSGIVQRIARDVLGDASLFTQITNADGTPIRDSRKLKQGMRLRLPGRASDYTGATTGV